MAAPFLGSVTARVARGQDAPATDPRRLVVMFTHYGCLTDRWFPENSHGPLSAADLAGTSIEALAPHVNKLLMPRGIRAMNEWTFDASLGQGNDPNLQVVGSYFTCVPVYPHTNDPFSFESATKFNAKPTAPSLDHVCAQQLSPGGIPLFMRVGGVSDSTQSCITYSAADQPFAGLGSPTEAFSALTGLFVPGEEMSPDSYRAVRGASVVDLVKDDLETLERVDMSAADRRKLEAWKQLLHETGGVVGSTGCNETLAGSLGLTEENLGVYGSSAAAGSDRVTAQVADNLDGADLFSNIAVLAALCDQNRVIFLKYPANYVYAGLGMTLESHSMANRTGSANMGGTCVEGVNDMIMTIDRYYAEKFAHLVGQLDSIEEGEGTLLDNTAAVWFQEFSDGAAYNLNNMPIIQAGSCGGYFKTGHAVNVDDGSSDLTRGNSSYACEEASRTDGTNIKATGTPVEFANAPINKYYCNLMNAIGVKAGPDGFPMVDGVAEVTHYGMYDDTTDFASGGDNPPKINDPGEFEELRANS